MSLFGPLAPAKRPLPTRPNETIGDIRAAVREVYGEAADEMRIQYGGSMNPKNASELMAKSEIDGGLIGGASLKAEGFQPGRQILGEQHMNNKFTALIIMDGFGERKDSGETP